MKPWGGISQVPFFSKTPALPGTSSQAPSFTKPGDIYIPQCDFSRPLYPKDTSPTEWKSCDDAYKFTWENDFKGEIVGLDTLSKTKLINSMGFCPQSRCQLFNVSGGSSDGMCPAGLCFTKVENGGPSYGACCFQKGGVFNAGALIGYYNKSQPSAKPIYKQSRIILGQPVQRTVGGSSGAMKPDETFDAFINANEIYPGLIATQCPLAGRPAGTENTIEDVKRMIVENDIRMWVSLAPDGLDRFLTRSNGQPPVYNAGSGSCGVFPLEFFIAGANSTYTQGVTNFKIVTNLVELDQGKVPFVEMSYTVTAHLRTLVDGRTQTVFGDKILFGDKISLQSKEVSELMVDDVTEDVAGSAEGVRGQSELSVSHAPPKSEEIHATGITSALGSISTLPVTVPGAWRKVSVPVKHFWYHNWKDFGIPPAADEVAIRLLARTAADVVKSGTSSVAVNCLSGRGRSGTFSAIVLGELGKARSHEELVDIVVAMREHRDGLIETPEQLRFAARVLQLPDTADCGVLCDAEKKLDKAMQASPYVAFCVGLLVAILVQACWRACGSKQAAYASGGGGRRSGKGKYHSALSSRSSDSEDRSPYSSDADCACPLTAYSDSSATSESSSINGGRLLNRTGSREGREARSGSKSSGSGSLGTHSPRTMEMGATGAVGADNANLEMSLVTAALTATQAVVAGVAKAAKSK